MNRKRPILKNRCYLYLTEFFAGMSVMAVELGASRLLAPYFSSSQIVWTIIIGTIMIAMALGNIYGGRKADKAPNPDKLYGRMIIAAVWIALIPVVGKYIILGISALLIFTVNSNFLVIAGFAACMVIFVFPLFLLGTVTPSLVKFSVDSLDDSGSVVGKLNASNTIGSIIGTFVPTFISIPACGTVITFLIFAGILLFLAIVYFVSSKVNFSKAKKVPISICIFLICVLLGHESSFAFWQSDLTYDVIMVDAYQDITIPFQMSTKEFFSLVRDHLAEDGVMVVNMNMRGNGEGNINQYLADTIFTVFSEVYTVDVDGSTNRELFASNNKQCLNTYQENIQLEEDSDLLHLMGAVSDGLEHYEASNYVMTDDKAPGIKGLIDSLN